MKRISMKAILLLAMALVILTGTVCGTIAWIVTDTDPVANTFTPGEVEITVTEDFDGKTKQNIKVRNDGDTSVYVRVAVSANWYKDNKIVGTYDFNSLTLQSGWTKVSDYYYYTGKVEAGQSTGTLFSAITEEKREDGAELVVDVLAQAVQAEPADAINDAGWEWQPN